MNIWSKEAKKKIICKKGEIAKAAMSVFERRHNGSDLKYKCRE
jgi:hypothetical protein